MKIGGYSDPHLCKRSSILAPGVRLGQCELAFEWAYDTFRSNDVDLIVNTGDFVHATVLDSDEITSVTRILSMNTDIPEIHVCGNHERYDVTDSNSINFINLSSNKQLITAPTKLSFDGTSLSFLPHCKQVTNEMIAELRGSKILFSHVDIYDSYVNDSYSLDAGITRETLSDLFSIVLNGHIHTHSVQTINSSSIVNVGSFTGLSFSDNYKYRFPSIYILDTDTTELEFIENPHALLFITVVADTLEGLIKQLPHSGTRKLAVRVRCSSRDEAVVSEYLRSRNDVVASRLLLSMDIREPSEVSTTDDFFIDLLSTSAVDKLKSFVCGLARTKYPVDQIISVLDEMQSKSVDIA